MSGDTSEEKTLPPTTKKLKDAREKGQVFHSNDMVAGITTAAAFAFIWVAITKIVRDFKLSVTAIQGNTQLPFKSQAWDATEILARNLGIYVVGLASIVVVLIVLVNMFILKGFLFSMEPIKPNFNNMNPIEGFKRIFSLKSLIELIKQILKTVLMVTVGVSIILYSLNTAFRVPNCQFSCVAGTLSTIIGPLLAFAVLIFLANGMLDLGLQRWLFHRKLKMTKTEYKRERKDQEGSPEVRGAQRRVRHALLNAGPASGVEEATVIVEGGGIAVGLRYVRGETPIPLLVCKGRGIQADKFLEYAYYSQIPVYTDADLAGQLQKRLDVGTYIPEMFFDEVALALQNAR